MSDKYDEMADAFFDSRQGARGPEWRQNLAGRFHQLAEKTRNGAYIDAHKDYQEMLNNFSIVMDELTGGLLSKTNYIPQVYIDAVYEREEKGRQELITETREADAKILDENIAWVPESLAKATEGNKTPKAIVAATEELIQGILSDVAKAIREQK